MFNEMDIEKQVWTVCDWQDCSVQCKRLYYCPHFSYLEIYSLG